MTDFNGLLPVSFLGIEGLLFQRMGELFRSTMGELLELLDGLLFEVRNNERYKVKESKGGRIDTLFGTVEYRRRVYIDEETGERVYGLDEALGLRKRARISPGLKNAAVLQAVDGPSYRGARDSLKLFYGHQVLSHETIRQCVLDIGKRIEKEMRRERENPRGTRKVDVLFIEADGLWVSRQRSGKREARLVISHEGWRPRAGAAGEYELVDRTHYYADGSEKGLWEEASRQLYSTYDLGDTMVVINGDRAKWIREGVGYFPNAMYQFDRFHLKRELKSVLREVPEACKAALDALDGNRSEALLALLREVRLREAGAREGLAKLRHDLERNSEALVDYRERLRGLGYETTGMRGMGSAESNMNRFSKRLKKQGRSWGKRGLSAMIHTMAKRFEGSLGAFASRLDEAIEEITEVLDDGRLVAGAGRLARDVFDEVACATTAHIPALDVGRSASGGLSRSLRRLSNALPAGLS